MNKHIWFYTSTVFLVIIVIMSGIILYYSCSWVDQKDSDLSEYLELNENNTFFTNGNCVPDANTAAKIGGVVVDNMCGMHLGIINVEYDSSNRLWKVNKGYLFSHGGFVVIEQDTGEIVVALLNK